MAQVSTRQILLRASRSIALAATREDGAAARVVLLHSAASLLNGIDVHWPEDGQAPVDPSEEEDPFASGDIVVTTTKVIERSEPAAVAS